jgi:hypothetical protein
MTQLATGPRANQDCSDGGPCGAGTGSRLAIVFKSERLAMRIVVRLGCAVLNDGRGRSRRCPRSLKRRPSSVASWRGRTALRHCEWKPGDPLTGS